MSKTFVLADPHFGHRLMASLRPWGTIEEHDEALIENWNRVVSPNDRVYVLGDLCMAPRHIPTIGKCNGRKILVKGNHDQAKIEAYLPYFDDIRACVTKPKLGLIMTHIPVHPGQLEYRWKLNVHGHLHEHVVQKEEVMIKFGHSVYDGPDLEKFYIPDPRYRCVSMEQINYTPLDFQEIIDACEKRM